MIRQKLHLPEDRAVQPNARSISRSGLYAACLLACAISLLPTGGAQASSAAAVGLAVASRSSELRFCLRGEPRTLNPLLVEDEPSETVRYLTGGVLIRLNRQTQQLEPELAESWDLSAGGRSITFHLRHNLYFSDGSRFDAQDVAYTFGQLLDPAIQSPVADGFRVAGNQIAVSVLAADRVRVTFPAAIASVERLFDELVVLSSRSRWHEKATLGPFYLADYRPGSFMLLKRNPNYWKHDAAGRRLPYLETVRLEIQANRGLESMRFQRGEVQLINALDPQFFDRLPASAVRDIGPSLDSEIMWFNQVTTAPIPRYKKAWFKSRNFRRAVLQAIDRAALARVVFAGHAQPAVGPVSPANRFWYNRNLRPVPWDRAAAINLLAADGFRTEHGVLRDAAGNPVEFSIVTNAGNKPREQMATMIQQDLGAIGMRVSLVTLDFASVIDRITRSFDYESCLLSPVTSDLDPNAQMNVWLSSAPNHQWNPSEKTPATPWEAEVDRLMKAQAATADPTRRKLKFDRVQQIVWNEAPFLYLITRDALCAVSPTLDGAQPVVLRPQTYWNVERLSLGGQVTRK